MQKTRQKIIKYLRQHGEATVDELSQALDNLTAVTVRHHLDVLRSQELVSAPEVLHRNSPGRPKYVYRLTQKAEAMFPKNLASLTDHLLLELKDALDDRQVDAIFDGIAERMASGMEPGPTDEPFEVRLARVVDHLNERGYDAHVEEYPDGVVLHTLSCPYKGVVESHNDLCVLDARYLSHLLGAPLRRLTYKQDDAPSCSYLVLRSETEKA